MSMQSQDTLRRLSTALMSTSRFVKGDRLTQKATQKLIDASAFVGWSALLPVLDGAVMMSFVPELGSCFLLMMQFVDLTRSVTLLLGGVHALLLNCC